MRIIAGLILAVGIVIAGGAAFYAQKMFDAQAALMRADPQTVKVMVAKHVLEPGTVLSPDDLLPADWPNWSIPPDAFTGTADIFGKGGEDRRIVINTIRRGEPIIDGKLSAPNQSGRIPHHMEPGMGAVSIPINAVTGVAGFIAPGDHVDILLTHDVEGTTESRVLLQRIRVLAIDQMNDTEASSPRVGRTATVAVTTNQALTLTLAQRKGGLALILRNKDGEIESDTVPVNMDDLNGIRTDGAVQKFIKLRRGNETILVPID